jgi:hypothetical protein
MELRHRTPAARKCLHPDFFVTAARAFPPSRPSVRLSRCKLQAPPCCCLCSCAVVQTAGYRLLRLLSSAHHSPSPPLSSPALLRQARCTLQPAPPVDQTGAEARGRAGRAYCDRHGPHGGRHEVGEVSLARQGTPFWAHRSPDA